MKNYNQKLLLISLIGTLSLANIGRHDIDWITNYEDFAMNNGKYKIGQKGIIVYKKDGSKSGIIDMSVPNFDGVIDEGNFALWDDYQLLTGVNHVGLPSNFTFITRHLRKDVELYSGYKEKFNQKNHMNDFINKFSENREANYRLKIGGDYSLTRMNKIAFDANATKAITINDFNRIKKGDFIARIGGGINAIALDIHKQSNVAPYGHLAGGLNKILIKSTAYDGRINDILYFRIDKEAKTPLDSATLPGDSGSPVFWWDKDNDRWLLAASNTGGTSAGYTKNTQVLSNLTILNKWKNDLNIENYTLKVGQKI